MKNVDKKCFFWAVISALYPTKKHSDRTSSYMPHEKLLKTEGIKRFEILNKINIKVYGIEKKILYHFIYLANRTIVL